MSSRTSPSTLLSDRNTSAAEQRMVLLLCVVYIAAALALIPFVTVELQPLPHFASLYGVAVLVADVCTYVLLSAQFGSSGARWLLRLSTAYLFSALMALLHILTYPGAFLPGVAVVGGPKTVGWLYAAWNLGFTALLLVAIVSVIQAETTPADSRRRAIWATLTAVVAAALLLTVMLVVGDPMLPVPVVGDRFAPVATAMNYLRSALAVVALLLVVAGDRRRRLVVLWLSLTLVAASVGPVLTDLGGRRYTLGWYAGRVSFVFASYTLLAVLLAEFVRLQHALAGAVGRLESQTVALTAEIERRELAERKLVSGERMNAIGQLVSGIAHDFNNLLTGVVGNLEVILRLTEEGRVHTSADRAKQAALRGARLTRSLLAFGRRQPLQSEVVDTGELVQRIMLLLQRVAGPQVEVVFDPAPGTWTCRADPAQLEVALLNLVVNARDAMPAGGRVTIATRNVERDVVVALRGAHELPPGEYVEVTVHDRGVGIVPADQERVFEPFFTTKGPGGGTGLGLSQVKGFAQQSHGDVAIESAVGIGTAVRMWLPRSAPLASEPVREDANAA